ncbi:MAG: hypothetical protein E7424_08860 [Ruminococcaceae bacterium]|nr:hypothetical protein [Oscillospiraceae bacterium]
MFRLFARGNICRMNVRSEAAGGPREHGLGGFARRVAAWLKNLHKNGTNFFSIVHILFRVPKNPLKWTGNRAKIYMIIPWVYFHFMYTVEDVVRS